MTRRARFATPASALLLGSIVWFFAPNAAAQQDVDTQVRAWMRVGDDAVAEQRFADAEQAYEKAYQLKPGFDVAANLGDAEAKLEKFAEAAAHYAYAIRTYPSSFDQNTKKALQSALAELQTKVATVRITVSQPGAAITVDGGEVGTSPLPDPIFLLPGSHTIEAKLDTRSASEPTRAEAGSRTTVTLNLALAPHQGNGRGSSTGPVLTGIGIGAFALGLVGGIVFTVAANGKAADAAGLAVNTGNHRDLQETQQTFANTALWSFVGAGVGATLAAIGTYFWVADEHDASSTAVHVTPWIGSSTGGLLIDGHW